MEIIETKGDEIVMKAKTITITDNAKKRFEDIRGGSSIPDEYLPKISVKGGGCNGFTYTLTYEEATDTDYVLSSNSMEIIVDGQSMQYISGLTLDFDNGLNGRGWLYKNPNAQGTCGCGKSASF